MFKFHHTAPFRAQPPILPSTAAYGKRLLKPCIRMGCVPKGMAKKWTVLRVERFMFLPWPARVDALMG